jgi:hypothetical protein
LFFLLCLNGAFFPTFFFSLHVISHFELVQKPKWSTTRKGVSVLERSRSFLHLPFVAPFPGFVSSLSLSLSLNLPFRSGVAAHVCVPFGAWLALRSRTALVLFVLEFVWFLLFPVFARRFLPRSQQVAARRAAR